VRPLQEVLISALDVLFGDLLAQPCASHTNVIARQTNQRDDIFCHFEGSQ